MDKLLEPDPKRLKRSHSNDADVKDESFEQYIDANVLADFENDEFLSTPDTSPAVANLLEELKTEPDPFGDDDEDKLFLMVNTQELWDQFEQEKIVWKVFGNSLIWRKIMEHLNFQDQKNIRLVCKCFNENLVSETHFLNRTVVHITPVRAQEKHFGSTTEFYKHFVIDSWCLRPENFLDTSSFGSSDWFYEKLINAETITLKATKPDSSIIQKVMQRIIASPTHLKQLAIDGSLLSQLPTKTKYQYKNDVTVKDRNVHVSEKFKSSLKNLLEFQILGLQSVDISHEDFRDVMKKLSGLLTSLEVIKIENSIGPMALRNLPQKASSLIQMIEDNKEKLTTLKVNTIFLWENFTGSIMEKSFPALHTLQMRLDTSKDRKDDVIKFFVGLPLLEDIDITILDNFDNAILEKISERSERLKRLRIKTSAFQVLKDKMWEFLSKLKYLEDFELNFPGQSIRHNCSLVTILDNLPHQIKKISIYGLPSSTTSLTREDFKKLDPSHIRELNLVNCRNAVNDVTMRFICQNFKLLRKLDVSGNMCTDYGFTGLDTYQNSTFSLTALKGLIELRMRNCTRITNETLIHAIKFLELKYLDVSENYGINSTGFTAVLRNNPSLELIKTLRNTITYNVGPTENYHEGKRTLSNAEISSACPRFKGFSFGQGLVDADSYVREEIDGYGYFFQAIPHPYHYFVDIDDDDDDDDGESDVDNEVDDDRDWHENRNNNAAQHVPYEPNYDSGPDSPDEDPDYDPDEPDSDDENSTDEEEDDDDAEEDSDDDE